MLPAGARLRRRAEFADTLRRGRRRASRGLVVVSTARADSDRCARVGFVVSKAVGPAVTRNRVRRRLRHLLRDRLGGLPPGTTVVVRALPGAATASWLDLGHAVDGALGRPPRPGVRR